METDQHRNASTLKWMKKWKLTNYSGLMKFHVFLEFLEIPQNSTFKEFSPRDVIRRLCNKDRDQGPKGIGLIGIDHVVTYNTSDK